MPGDHVVHSGRAALVRDEQDVSSRLDLEKFPREVRVDALRSAVLQFAWTALGGVDEFLESTGRKARVDSECHRVSADRGNGHEGLGRIESQVLVDCAQHRIDVCPAQQQRVSIGRRAGGCLRADPSAGAGMIVNEHALAQAGRHRLADQPCDNIGRTARREGHNNLDGAIGKGLGPAGPRHRCRRTAEHGHQKREPPPRNGVVRVLFGKARS